MQHTASNWCMTHFYALLVFQGWYILIPMFLEPTTEWRLLGSATYKLDGKIKSEDKFKACTTGK